MTDEEMALLMEMREGSQRMLAESQLRTKTLNNIVSIVKGIEAEVAEVKQRVQRLENRMNN